MATSNTENTKTSEKITDQSLVQCYNFHNYYFHNFINSGDTSDFSSNQNVWDEYDEDNIYLLKNKIGYITYGGDLPKRTMDLVNYNPEQTEKINEIYDRILLEAPYYVTKKLHIGLLLICCYDETNIFTKYLIKIRKCISSKNSCCVYVDDFGRVYRSWDDYLNNNLLPKGTMVVPDNGEYNFDEHLESVKVSVHKSPASCTKKKILNGIDVTGTVVTFGTIIASAAALIPAITVAPAVIIAGCVTTAGIGIITGSASIHDRRIHKESLSIKNPVARSDYLNITGSILNIASVGASKVLSVCVKKGIEIPQAGKCVFNAIKTGNIVASGCYSANSLYKIVISKDSSRKDILEFITSLVFLGHSVMSFQTANSLISECQNEAIQDFEKTLISKRARKIFKKAKNTANTETEKTELIRKIKIYKNDNALSVFGNDQQLDASIVTNQNPILANEWVMLLCLMPTKTYINNRLDIWETVDSLLKEVEEYTKRLLLDTAVHMIDKFKEHYENLQKVFSCDKAVRMIDTIENHSEKLQNALPGEEVMDMIITNLKKIFPGVDMLIVILKYLYSEEIKLFFKFIKTITNSGNSNNSENPIETKIISFIKENVDSLVKRFFAWITKIKNNIEKKLKLINEKTKIVNCAKCKGFYYSYN